MTARCIKRYHEKIVGKIQSMVCSMRQMTFQQTAFKERGERKDRIVPPKIKRVSETQQTNVNCGPKLDPDSKKPIIHFFK